MTKVLIWYSRSALISGSTASGPICAKASWAASRTFHSASRRAVMSGPMARSSAISPSVMAASLRRNQSLSFNRSIWISTSSLTFSSSTGTWVTKTGVASGAISPWCSGEDGTVGISDTGRASAVGAEVFSGGIAVFILS